MALKIFLMLEEIRMNVGKGVDRAPNNRRGATLLAHAAVQYLSVQPRGHGLTNG